MSAVSIYQGEVLTSIPLYFRRFPLSFNGKHINHEKSLEKISNWKKIKNTFFNKRLGLHKSACARSENTSRTVQTPKTSKNHSKTMKNHWFTSKINGFSLISLSELVRCSRHAYRGAGCASGEGRRDSFNSDSNDGDPLF